MTRRGWPRLRDRMPRRSGGATSRPRARWPSCWPASRRARPGRAAGPGGPGRRALLRQLRPDAQGQDPGRRVRLHDAEPPPAPRPGECPALSFAYAMLAKDCFSAACTVGFDPYQGFYHVGRHGRPSLALDLMEEFRPVIADSVVLNLINNGMLAERDFLTWRDACQLTDAGREDLLQGLRAAQGDRGDAPGLRLQDALRPDARGAGADARGLRPRRIAPLRGIHRPLKSVGQAFEPDVRSRWRWGRVSFIFHTSPKRQRVSELISPQVRRPRSDAVIHTSPKRQRVN